MSGKHRFATEEIEKFSTVDLITELKRRYQVLSRPERSCVVLGSPYTGVSTQVGFLRKEWGMCSIKREGVLPKSDSDLNEAVTKVSDEIGSFRCRRGFAIENFPQTDQEAKVFDDMVSAKHADKKDYRVILLSMPHSTKEEQDASIVQLTSRATGHMIHEPSGRIYNSNVPEIAPQTPNMDDITGEPLVCQRMDPSGISTQFTGWLAKNEANLRQYFGQRVKNVDASQSRDAVSMNVSRVLLDNVKPVEASSTPGESTIQHTTHDRE